MMPVRNYRELIVWQKSMDLVETQILVAERLNYIDRQTVQQLMELTAEVGRLHCGLVNALKRKKT